MGSNMMFSDPSAAMGLMKASFLNNEANMLEARGDLIGAEKKHLEALALKSRAQGEDSIAVALTKNGLGGLYLVMNNLDEAQKMLEDAYAIRSQSDDFDTACTRDNLGRLWEMRGDFTKAREIREKGAPSRMLCSHFNVGPLSFLLRGRTRITRAGGA